jgi:WD40 repeat protein
LAVSGGQDKVVRLWETQSGTLLASLEGHAAGVFAVSVSADGRLIASCAVDGTIRLWDAASRRHLATLTSHPGIVYGVALSADGRRLVSGGDDGFLKLWNVQSGTCLHALRPDRLYERMEITDLTGMTEAQKLAMLALGAREDPAAGR